MGRQRNDRPYDGLDQLSDAIAAIAKPGILLLLLYLLFFIAGIAE